MKVLLIVESCNLEWATVHSVGFGFYSSIAKYADVTLVTHERNRENLEKIEPFAQEIIYIGNSPATNKYLQIVEKICAYRGYTIWPLFHALAFLAYAEFDHKVYLRTKRRIADKEFDIVHAITPVIPRYPFKVSKLCTSTPFVLGPLNGGLPYPPGFKYLGKKEHVYLNILKKIAPFLIPSYRQTYMNSSVLIAGSVYTSEWIKKQFPSAASKIWFMHENGLHKNYFQQDEAKVEPKKQEDINILFAGRLVPYKGADILLEAVGKLGLKERSRIRVTLLGGDVNTIEVKDIIEKYDLKEQVFGTGWVTMSEAREFYKEADIFCFPSVREFGGAVVLEAMASGLPCVVVDYGGIGEYVTDKCGIKVKPISRDYLVMAFKEAIERLIYDVELREQLSEQAINRALEYLWESKAEKIVDLYSSLLKS